MYFIVKKVMNIIMTDILKEELFIAIQWTCSRKLYSCYEFDLHYDKQQNALVQEF